MSSEQFRITVDQIFEEYRANADLYDPIRGITVPPLDGIEYSVTPVPQEGAAEPNLRVSLGGHGEGGPIYIVKPDEIAYNPGRSLSENDDFYIYSADEDEFLTDPATAQKMLRFVQGAHRHARAFKRRSP